MIIPEKWIWYKDLILVLLHKELVTRYKGSALGFLWSLMNPLAQAGIFYIVFNVYMRFAIPNYLIVLLAALFPWQWFSNSIICSPNTYVLNPTLVKKVAFPRQTIPLVTNLQDMVHFCMALPVFVVFKLSYGLYPAWSWLWGIPLLMILSLATIYGASLFLGSINLFFKDLGNLTSILVNILFYGTPILYTLEQVPEKYHIIIKCNPLAPILISWRTLLYDNTFLPDYLLLAAFYASVILALGAWVYSKLNKRFAEVM